MLLSSFHLVTDSPTLYQERILCCLAQHNKQCHRKVLLKSFHCSDLISLIHPELVQMFARSCFWANEILRPNIFDIWFVAFKLKYQNGTLFNNFNIIFTVSIVSWCSNSFPGLSSPALPNLQGKTLGTRLQSVASEISTKNVRDYRPNISVFILLALLAEASFPLYSLN